MIPRRPATASLIRIVGRFFGETVQGSNTVSELLIARLTGIDDDGAAYAALLEVGDRFCRPSIPACRHCPLRQFCMRRSRLHSE
jgi:adenine-specific DNA glycosylase